MKSFIRVRLKSAVRPLSGLACLGWLFAATVDDDLRNVWPSFMYSAPHPTLFVHQTTSSAVVLSWTARTCAPCLGWGTSPPTTAAAPSGQTAAAPAAQPPPRSSLLLPGALKYREIFSLARETSLGTATFSDPLFFLWLPRVKIL